MGDALLSVTEQLDAIEQNSRLLTIDDDTAVLEYYQEVFTPGALKGQSVWETLAVIVDLEEPKRELEFELTTVTSGELGVQAARKALAEHRPYSVAFVDMRMPGGMDGLETAQQLRAIDPRIMLVIVTAYSDHQLEEIQRRLLNNVLFLNKPLSVDEATQTVRMLNQNWKDREKNKVLEMQMVSHAKMAALGNMAVRIGHEINQPLSYINGMLQLQRMELEGGGEFNLEEQLDEVDLAIKQTVRIKEIIDSLRVFAHPDRDRREQLNLSQAIDHVRRIFRGRLESQRIQFRTLLESEALVVYANPSQLQRILTNLMSNAIDAVLEKREQQGARWEAEISIEAISRPMLDRVEVIFSDNGPGIPASLQDRIFDPFVTTKEPGRGTGLGLSEIHGMLIEHQATIEYSPLPEREGARFIILFPIDEEER